MKPIQAVRTHDHNFKFASTVSTLHSFNFHCNSSLSYFRAADKTSFTSGCNFSCCYSPNRSCHIADRVGELAQELSSLLHHSRMITYRILHQQGLALLLVKSNCWFEAHCNSDHSLNSY